MIERLVLKIILDNVYLFKLVTIPYLELND